MKTYKTWTCLTLSLIIFVLGIIATANYIIDPYGMYHYSGKSFNYNKIIDSDPYLIKTFQSRKYQPEAIVLGTSRAMRLDPPIIKDLTGEDAYNLGLSAAAPYINYKYLEYAIKVNPNLKTVYLGLDFEVFDANHVNHANYDEERLESPFYMKDWFSTLLSENAIKDSYKVITDNLHQTSTFTEHRYLGDGSFDETLVYPPNTNQQTLHMIPTTLQLSSDHLQYINQIKELCDNNYLDLYMYISPVHAIILETYWQNDLWSTFEDWKRQLVEIAPVWDFSGYHDISMSSLQQSDNYNDLSHFSKKVGNLILYRMLQQQTDRVPAYFGVYLTPEHIEHHLEHLRANRNLWSDRDKNLLEVLDHY